MSTSERAVIIGGGVIGGCTAYYLSRKGWDVTLVEKDQFGHGASWGNCGLIVPTHLLPLNTPANLKAGLKWMLKRNAPLYIRPTLDIRRLSWFLRFAGNCHPASTQRSTIGMAALLNPAVSLYDELIELEGISCEWDQQGSLHLFETEKELQSFAVVDEVARRFGLGARMLDKQALLEKEPALDDRLAGGWFDPFVAQIRPDRFMTELMQVLERHGVDVIESCEFESFRSESGRAVSAITSNGTIEGKEFIVATGAWTPKLNSILSVRIPIEPGKGYSVTLPESDGLLTKPCFFENARVVATHWKSCFRLGGTMEFSGYDDSMNTSRIMALFEGASEYLREFNWTVATEEWCGWRPMTIDGLPIIDRTPGLSNVMIAAGHNMLGLTLGPVTGKLVAELISGEPPHVDPAPYSISRF